LVMFPTIRQIQEFAEHVGKVRAQVAATTQRTNPFELAQVLVYFRKRIAELEAMVVADHQGHAEASRAVEGAARDSMSSNRGPITFPIRRRPKKGFVVSMSSNRGFSPYSNRSKKPTGIGMQSVEGRPKCSPIWRLFQRS
jgi:hypothetical protein